MQSLRLNETCRMICYSLLSNDVNFVEMGLSGYDVKPRFGAFQCEFLLQNPLFLRKNFGDTRHPCEKNKPTLDHSGRGGGLHCKACLLMA